MRLDALLTPGEPLPSDFAARTVVVIDVLRATSTMVEALGAGAKSIYPVASIEDALHLVKTLGRGEVLLSGERRCLPIDGFDLGNSPREFTAKRVRGKTLVMTTTNGTYALSLALGAGRIVIGSLLNLETVVEDLAATEAEPIFLCAGRERGFALEDVVCAGEMTLRLMELRPGAWSLSDGATAAVTLAERFPSGPELFASTGAGKLLIGAGLHADLEACAERNRHAILPVLHDRQITLAAPLARLAEPAD